MNITENSNIIDFFEAKKKIEQEQLQKSLQRLQEGITLDVEEGKLEES